jgi:prepilin peptidase CpaA
MGMSLLNALPIVVFSAAMIFAGLRDLTTMTIPNWLTLALAFSFFAFAVFAGMPLAEIAEHAGVGLAVLLIAMGFFAMRWIGGGDAKLMAAIALWLGWAQAIPYFVTASLFGGALTLLILGYRRLPLPIVLVRQPWLSRLHDQGEGIPYGLALAVAALLIFPETDIFRLTVALG